MLHWGVIIAFFFMIPDSGFVHNMTRHEKSAGNWVSWRMHDSPPLSINTQLQRSPQTIQETSLWRPSMPSSSSLSWPWSSSRRRATYSQGIGMGQARMVKCVFFCSWIIMIRLLRKTRGVLKEKKRYTNWTNNNYGNAVYPFLLGLTIKP